MPDGPDGLTPSGRRGRYLALAALVPLGAAAAGALPLAFPPRPIAARDLLAMAAGAENTGGFAYGTVASVRADTALYTGLTDAPPVIDSAATEASAGTARPAVFVIVRVEDRWMVVRADPAMDCMDTTRIAVGDSAGGVPRAYEGRLERLPQPLARRVVASLNRRTPDLTDDGRDGDRWSRRQLLPVMLASEGSVARRARCLVRRTQAARGVAAVDSVRPAAATVAPRPITDGPGPEDLLAVLHDRGVEVALGWLDGVRAAAPDAPAAREEQVNAVGYALMRGGLHDDALAVLRWNVERRPRSANAHDSVAEALEATGNTWDAVEHSRRALELVDRDASLSAPFRDQVRRAATDRLLRLR